MRAVRSSRLWRRLAVAMLIASFVAPVFADASDAVPREPVAPKAPPNIVLVVIDTLRPDRLGFYGNDRETAPFLARLATRGAVFTNAVSTSSWTAPSAASLFTSLYPVQHGVERGFLAHKKHAERIKESGGASLDVNRLPEAIATLPEILRAHGYRTFGVTANVNMGEEIGFTRGFDRFEHLRLHKRSAYSRNSEKRRKKYWNTASDVVDVVENWQSQIIGSSKPYFLYLHLNDPHGPYLRKGAWFQPPPGQPPKSTEAGELAWALARYDSEIGYADQNLARIEQRIEFVENSIVVVVSDHGEAFGEHGRTTHGSKVGLWGVVNRVLMMFYGPEHGILPRRVPDNVSLIDVMPTVLELVGAAPADGRAGRSLVPYLRSTASGSPAGIGDRPLFAHVIGTKGDPERPERRSVLLGKWKLIVGEGTPKLFDVRADPGELQDLAKKHPETVAKLSKLIEAHASRRVVGAKADVEIDGPQLERLRALGYAE